MSEYPSESLHSRYRVAMGLAAMLVVLNQVLVLPSLLRLTTDAPVINIAGRQRMLSQKLAKAALALEREGGEKSVVASWSSTRFSCSGRPLTTACGTATPRCRFPAATASQ